MAGLDPGQGIALGLTSLLQGYMQGRKNARDYELEQQKLGLQKQLADAQIANFRSTAAKNKAGLLGGGYTETGDINEKALPPLPEGSNPSDLRAMGFAKIGLGAGQDATGVSDAGAAAAIDTARAAMPPEQPPTPPIEYRKRMFDAELKQRQSAKALSPSAWTNRQLFAARGVPMPKEFEAVADQPAEPRFVGALGRPEGGANPEDLVSMGMLTPEQATGIKNKVPSAAFPYLKPKATEKKPGMTYGDVFAAAGVPLPKELEGKRNEAFPSEMRSVVPKKPKPEKPESGLTPGQKAVDVQFGKDYADWQLAGGKVGAMRDVAELGPLADRLEKMGGVAEKAGRVLPRFAGDFINADMASIRDRAELAVQKSLRKILGAQYTEKEGQQFFARSWNPRQSPAENAKRMRGMISELQGMIEAKEASARAFEKSGTLSQYHPASNARAIQAEPAAGGGEVRQYSKSRNQTRVMRNGKVVQVLDGDQR